MAAGAYGRRLFTQNKNHGHEADGFCIIPAGRIQDGWEGWALGNALPALYGKQQIKPLV